MKLKLFLLAIFVMSSFSYAKENPIRIGIAPHSSTRVILQSHQDLRLFLENYFKRSVQILTAKNFSEFTKRSNTGTYYDLILTSPNLAVLAQRLGGYTPIMTYTKGLSTILLATNESILESKKLPLHVIGLDPVSFPTLDAQEWLEKKGFEDGGKVNYTYTSATDSSISILLNNNADMIIMSLPNYIKLITKKNKDSVHVIYQSNPKPSRIYLAKTTDGITLKEWETALDAFSKSPEGKKHLEITKLEGFKKINPKDLNNLNSIVEKTMKRLYK
ncbi:MAG: phosphate/phosphite/phosphonate ABC transporter substrate-binding protein [Candidatus Marinarcus sp.]|uniref:phosphate/phosphite/phosphonate ABC transporter substrate-binding protein n=1 Tax=Candidatus Marinarcus sp. TaxID=3100987 RepID=UPI003AFFBC19